MGKSTLEKQVNSKKENGNMNVAIKKKIVDFIEQFNIKEKKNLIGK